MSQCNSLQVICWKIRKISWQTCKDQPHPGTLDGANTPNIWLSYMHILFIFWLNTYILLILIIMKCGLKLGMAKWHRILRKYLLATPRNMDINNLASGTCTLDNLPTTFQVQNAQSIWEEQCYSPFNWLDFFLIWGERIIKFAKKFISKI